MKDIKIVLFTIVTLFSFFSCSQTETSKWESDVERIQYTSDSLIAKSFIFDDAKMKEDIIYLKIHAIGFTSDRDRPFEIEQIEKDGVNNGVAGIHFLPLSDEFTKSKMFIPKNQSYCELPIKLLRDVSLKDDSYELHFRLITNGAFSIGEANKVSKTIIISDSYVKPATWVNFTNTFMGQYSQVKHWFMHKVLLELYPNGSVIPDDDFVDRLSSEGSCYYYAEIFSNALIKYNLELGEDGPLMSEPTESAPGGEIIRFAK